MAEYSIVIYFLQVTCICLHNYKHIHAHINMFQCRPNPLKDK